MTKRIILHIGTHKTGSSSIQYAFNEYNDSEYKYAELGFENHSIPFYTAFSSDFLKYRQWTRLGLSQKDIESKKAQCQKRIEVILAKNKIEHLIFSGEDLCKLKLKEIQSLYNLLKQYSNHIEVYAYLRSPAGFITSNLQERIKAGITKQLITPPEYKKKLFSYFKIFGKENVHLRLFNRQTLLNGDIVEDFSKWIGSNTPPKKSIKTNESLSSNAIKYIHLLNQSNPLTTGDVALIKAREELINILRNIFPGQFKIPKNIISPYFDANDINWVNSECNMNFEPSGSCITENSLADNEVERYLTDISEESTLILQKYLYNNGVQNEFELNPSKLINRLYYLCIVKTQSLSDIQHTLALKVTKKAINLIRK